VICHGWAWLQSSLILSCYLETKLRSSEMAGVSHLRTKKEAERREIIDKIFSKCGDGGDGVEISRFMDYLSGKSVSLDEHDIGRLNKITDDHGIIEKEAFVHFFKKSDVLKDFLDSQRRTDHLDKALLAFKAIDKDGSGSITVEELGQLSEKMSKKKSEALMKKLDVDGDGKITLEEFRELFVKIDK